MNIQATEKTQLVRDAIEACIKGKELLNQVELASKLNMSTTKIRSLLGTSNTTERLLRQFLSFDKEGRLLTSELKKEIGTLTDKHFGDELLRMGAENRNLKREVVQLNKKRVLEDKILDVVKDCAISIPPINVKKSKVGKTKQSSNNKELLALWSDFHGSEVVDAEEMSYLNEYNSTIMAKRFQYMVDYIIHKKHKYDNITRLNIALLGDFSSGNIHDELEITNDIDIVTSSLSIASMISQGIVELSAVFDCINVFGVPGNHGRLQKKKRAKRKYVNWDFVIYKFIEEQLKLQTQIECSFPKSIFIMKNILGDNYLFMHGDCIRCFTPEMPVIMSNFTTKHICNIKPGDTILSGDGHPRKVADVMEYQHDGPICIVNIESLPKPSWRITPNHKVLSLLQQKVDGDYKDMTPEWIEVGHLSKGDYVVTPTPIRSGNVITMKKQELIGTSLPEDIHPNRKVLRDEMPIDHRIGYILGQYLGDGSIYGRNDKVKGNNFDYVVEISYNSEEQDFWDEYKECVNSLFGYTPKEINRSDMDVRCQRITVYNQEFAAIMKALGGIGSRTKMLHPAVFNWPIATLKSMLKGYLRADGHTARRKHHSLFVTSNVIASTSSLELGSQLFWIARICGYKPCLKASTRSGKKELLVMFFGDDARELGPITQRNYEHHDDVVKPSNRWLEDIEKGYVFRRITKIYREHYIGPKYDLTIEDVPEYIVNGAVVHNSYFGIPFYGIKKTADKLADVFASKDIIFRNIFLGHFHSTGQLDKANGEIIVNSSMVGGNEFSLGDLFTISKPKQLLMCVERGIGTTWRDPIVLDVADKLIADEDIRYNIHK